MSLKLIGAGLSPFVRKCRVLLAEKEIAYEHDPMAPFGVSDEYKRMHPQGKIPTLVDGQKVIPDSSAICTYLEGRFPEPAFYPSDPYLRARAIWYEELADSGLINGTIVPFQQRVLAPVFFKREADEELVAKALQEILPPYFDYLEREIGGSEWLLEDRFGIADVAIGTQLANFAYGGEEVDASRWPQLAAYGARIHQRPSFAALLEEDQKTLASLRS